MSLALNSKVVLVLNLVLVVQSKARYCLSSHEFDQLKTKILKKNSNNHKRFELLAKSIKISCDLPKMSQINRDNSKTWRLRAQSVVLIMAPGRGLFHKHY